MNINPITSEDELKKQVQAEKEAIEKNTKPVEPISTNVQQNINNSAVPPANLQPTLAPPPFFNPAVNDLRKRVEIAQPGTSENVYGEAIFSYRLPLASYVLAVFYAILAALLIYILIPFINSYISIMSHYSSTDPDTNSLYSYGPYIEAIKNMYTEIFMKLGSSLAICLVIFFALVKKTPIARYIVIIVSSGAVGYLLYLINELSKSLEDTIDITNMGSFYQMIPFYMIVALFVATIIYMVGPKATRAYK